MLIFTMISYNVVVFMNPKGLKEQSEWALRHLALQECLPESTSSKILAQTKEQ